MQPEIYVGCFITEKRMYVKFVNIKHNKSIIKNNVTTIDDNINLSPSSTTSAIFSPKTKK